MHTTTVPVRFRDLDALGHLNSSVYLTYMETARVELAQVLAARVKARATSSGRGAVAEGGAMSAWHQVPFLVASARCEYLRPVHGPEPVEVQTWVSRIGSSSWDLDYRVLARGETVALGRTVQVAYDHRAGQAVRLDDAWRAALEGHQGERLALRE